MDLATRVVSLAMLLFIGGLMWFLPVMKGPDAFFGVTVSEEFHRGAKARRYLRAYQGIIGLLTAAAAAAVVWAGPNLAVLAFLAAVLLPMFVLGAFWYIVRPHELRPQALEYAGGPPTEATARSKWRYVRPCFEVLLAALLLVGAGLAWWRYPQLPERVPTHWNAMGQADGWASKNPIVVAKPLVMMVLTQGFLLWMLVGLAQVPERLPAERAEEYRAARERYMRLWANWTNFMRLCLMVTFGGILWSTLYGVEEQMRGAVPPGMIALMASMALLLLSIIGLMVMVTRNRAALRAIAGPGSIEGAAPTEGWIAGSIYYNPRDPSVWVEKRLGVGWTLNMARWQSWGAMLLIIGLPLGMVLLMAVASPK